MALDQNGLAQIGQTVLAVGRLGPSGVDLLGTAFLTTAAGKFADGSHVVGQDHSNLVLILPKTKSMADYQDTSDQQVQTARATVVAHDPFRDLCVLQGPFDARSNLPIGGADAVAVGSEIAVFGFPHSNFGRLVLTYERAEVGAKVLIDSGGIKSKHVVLNTQARPGQSGSPVLSLPNLRVIGVLIGSYAPRGGSGISLGGVDPHTLHQTTHAISAEYVIEML